MQTPIHKVSLSPQARDSRFRTWCLGVMSGQLAMIIVPIFASMFYEMNKTYTITLTSIFGMTLWEV